MSDLDESIGKVLLEQKNDPDSFQRLMKQAKEQSPELFEDSTDEDNKKIDDYNRKVDEYNKKVEEE